MIDPRPLPAIFVNEELYRLRMQRLGAGGYTPEDAARVNREITVDQVYTHSRSVPQVTHVEK